MEPDKLGKKGYCLLLWDVANVYLIVVNISQDVLLVIT